LKADLSESADRETDEIRSYFGAAVKDICYIQSTNLVHCWHRFEALLEREWLQAGHPFGDRCEKSAFATSQHRQESPVFLLFLDCAWQV